MQYQSNIEHRILFGKRHAHSYSILARILPWFYLTRPASMTPFINLNDSLQAAPAKRSRAPPRAAANKRATPREPGGPAYLSSYSKEELAKVNFGAILGCF